MKIKHPEILAPVGNTDVLTAAVRSGADAVYLGCENFNARRNAKNFSLEELVETVKYCRIRGVKVYLTLNTLIKDVEMQSAIDTAVSAAKAGVDGIIVADLGLAGLIHKRIPELPLHASTQMTVHSVSALPFLKKAGFSRVVVSREMSRDELKFFCLKARECGIEVEVFIHGALCMSVSGQCLFSAILGGRSGNRGLCAGPCRLPFMATGGNGYDLSLKDLSLINYIKELSEMGVASFKIEGRMKRPEYVAAAVYAISAAVDGNDITHIGEILKNVFSRTGFTASYYEGAITKEMFGIRTKDDVVSSSKAYKGIHEFYRREYQRVPIKARLEMKTGMPIKLTFSDGENTAVSEAQTPEAAKTSALDRNRALEVISKLGSTPYYIEEFCAEIDSGLAGHLSVLNSLRRECTQKLDEMRQEPHKYRILPNDEHKTQNRSSKKGLFCRFASHLQMPDDISGIHTVVFPLETQPAEIPSGIRAAVEIPRFTPDETLVRNKLRMFALKGYSFALCGTLAAVEIAREEGFSVIGDTGLNIFNSHCASVVADMGIEETLLSVELKISEAQGICANISKGITAYGKIPLMLCRSCPIGKGDGCKGCKGTGQIRDRKGEIFEIQCRTSSVEILNSRPIWMADKPEINNFDFVMLYFTNEDKKEAEDIISAYKQNNVSRGGFTRGLYYRGVL